MNTTKITGFAGLICSLSATPAFAHHAMGGDTPATLTQGLLSGLAHPVIGIDHLAFLVAMGIAAACTRVKWSAPLAFIAATIAGCLLFVGGTALPGVELGVATSVVLVGCLAMSGRQFTGALLIGLFAIAGLFHGMAYGGAIVGAESTPLAAYLIGFGGIQFAIATSAGALARYFTAASATASLNPRLAGAVATGVGVAVLIENLEGLFAVV